MKRGTYAADEENDMSKYAYILELNANWYEVRMIENGLVRYANAATMAQAEAIKAEYLAA